LINGLWLNNSYVYTAQDTSKAVLLTPANQSVLTEAATVFTWDAISGATGYWLNIGCTNGGTDIYSADQGRALTQTVVLPTDGRQLFVTLNTRVQGQWLASDSTLTAAGNAVTPTSPQPASAISSTPTSPTSDSSTTSASPTPVASSVPTASATSSNALSNTPPADARMLSPTDQSSLSGSPVTFTWDPGASATEYWLGVGTSTIATDLYNAGQGSNHSVTIALPVDGSPLYVTLSSLVNGHWQSSQYLYQAALPKSIPDR
jgi:hypothetical protein